MPEITVLASLAPFVGKTWYRDNEGHLATAKTFPRLWHMDRIAWGSPTDLWSILGDCADSGVCCVVRGQPVNTDSGPYPRDGSTLTDAPCSWVSLDIDAEHLPNMDPAAVRSFLPGPFRSASCWWQRTASSGIKPGVRQRFFFALDDAVDSESWREYWRGNTVGVDASVFKHTQVNYLAAPRFGEGVLDPVGVQNRYGVLPGLPLVKVAPIRATVRSKQASRVPRRPTVGADAASLYRYYCAVVRGAIEDVDKAEDGERQMVLVAKAARVVGVALGAGIDPEPDLEALRAAALEQRPNDAAEIDRALVWALDNVIDPKYPGGEE